MSIEIRKADRGDLKNLLEIQNCNEMIIDRKLCDRFDEILTQTNHKILLAFQNREPVGTLSVTVVDGIGAEYPKTVFSGAKIKNGYKNKALERLLFEKAKYIADEIVTNL